MTRNRHHAASIMPIYRFCLHNCELFKTTPTPNEMFPLTNQPLSQQTVRIRFLPVTNQMATAVLSCFKLLQSYSKTQYSASDTIKKMSTCKYIQSRIAGSDPNQHINQESAISSVITTANHSTKPDTCTYANNVIATLAETGI